MVLGKGLVMSTDIREDGTPKSTIEKLNNRPLNEPIEGELMPSDVGGAPTKYTPLIVGKLVASFNNGYNITEACQYAGVHRDTYYEWITSKPGFSDKMEEAKNMVNRRAKEVVTEAINAGDSNLAFKYLQVRDPDFKAKLQVDPPEDLKKDRKKIQGFLDEPTTYDSPSESEPDASGAEPAAEATDSSGEEVASTTPDIS